MCPGSLHEPAQRLSEGLAVVLKSADGPAFMRQTLSEIASSGKAGKQAVGRFLVTAVGKATPGDTQIMDQLIEAGASAGPAMFKLVAAETDDLSRRALQIEILGHLLRTNSRDMLTQTNSTVLHMSIGLDRIDATQSIISHCDAAVLPELLAASELIHKQSTGACASLWVYFDRFLVITEDSDGCTALEICCATLQRTDHLSILLGLSGHKGPQTAATAAARKAANAAALRILAVHDGSMSGKQADREASQEQDAAQAQDERRAVEEQRLLAVIDRAVNHQPAENQAAAAAATGKRKRGSAAAAELGTELRVTHCGAVDNWGQPTAPPATAEPGVHTTSVKSSPFGGSKVPTKVTSLVLNSGLSLEFGEDIYAAAERGEPVQLSEVTSIVLIGYNTGRMAGTDGAGVLKNSAMGQQLGAILLNGCPKLNSVSSKGGCLTPSATQSYGGHTSASVASASFRACDDQGLIGLSEQLAQHPTLSSVDLSSSSLTPAGGTSSSRFSLSPHFPLTFLSCF